MKYIYRVTIPANNIASYQYYYFDKKEDADEFLSSIPMYASRNNPWIEELELIMSLEKDKK